jgi:hypothetical protein
LYIWAWAYRALPGPGRREKAAQQWCQRWWARLPGCGPRGPRRRSYLFTHEPLCQRHAVGSRLLPGSLGLSARHTLRRGDGEATPSPPPRFSTTRLSLQPPARSALSGSGKRTPAPAPLPPHLIRPRSRSGRGGGLDPSGLQGVPSSY